MYSNFMVRWESQRKNSCHFVLQCDATNCLYNCLYNYSDGLEHNLLLLAGIFDFATMQAKSVVEGTHICVS